MLFRTTQNTDRKEHYCCTAKWSQAATTLQGGFMILNAESPDNFQRVPPILAGLKDQQEAECVHAYETNRKKKKLKLLVLK